MKKNGVLLIVAFLLSSCVSVETPVSTRLPAPIIFQTAIPPAIDTQPPVGTLESTPTATQEASPLPTELTAQAVHARPTYAVIPPEPSELERWRAYEEALGNALYERVSRVDVICEWQIMGRAENVVYVWTVCSGFHPSDLTYLYSDSIEAAVYLGPDGEVQSVGTVENTPGSTYGERLRTLFPPDVIEKFGRGPFADEMLEHLASRQENPEPPLFVLYATSTP